MINNLALAYALDGKADKAEDLLRKAVASGHEDKRVRQNLALVLGLEGKFDEARQVASVDMSEQEAKANMTYLRNMLTSPTALASAKGDGGNAISSGGSRPSGGDDWQPCFQFSSCRRGHSHCRGDATRAPQGASDQAG